jgi:hypothetical protein
VMLNGKPLIPQWQDVAEWRTFVPR